MASAQTSTPMATMGLKIQARPRVQALDGLRGIAVMTVVLFHFLAAPAGGWLGVDLFFVLSGYLITSTILQDIHTFGNGTFRPVDAGWFYRRRALRILPALFEMCLLYGAIKLIDPAKVTRFWENISAALFFYSNWSRAMHLDYPDYLGHTWSLAIEEQFYLMWPAVLLIFLRSPSARGERRLAGAVVVMIVAIAILRFRMSGAHMDTVRVYDGTDTRIDTILIGCLLALVSRTAWFRRVIPRCAVLCASIAGAGALFIMWMMATTDWRNPWYYRYGLTLLYLSVAAIVIYVSVFPQATAARWLSWKPLTFTGRRSYAIYLFHVPIFMALFYLYGQHQGWVCLLLGGVPTFLLATLSWRYVESPALQLWRRRLTPGAAFGT